MSCSIDYNDIPSPQIVAIMILEELKGIRKEMKAEVTKLRKDISAAVSNALHSPNNSSSFHSHSFDKFHSQPTETLSENDENVFCETPVDTNKSGARGNSSIKLALDQILQLNHEERVPESACHASPDEGVRIEKDATTPTANFLTTKNSYNRLYFASSKRPSQTLVKKWRCKFCHKFFSASSALKRHVANIHLPRVIYACPDCGKKFRDKESFSHHNCIPKKPSVEIALSSSTSDVDNDIHTPSSNLTAINDNSSYTFAATAADERNTEFGLHVSPSSSHKKRKLQYRSKCKECTEDFANSYQLRKHVTLVHRKQSDFVCTFCDKSFYDSYHLNRHLRSHTGEKPYKCRSCQKCFATSEHLKRHSITHLPQDVKQEITLTASDN